MPRYVFDVRHLDDGNYLDAWEFAVKVMRGLVEGLDEDGEGWAMEVTQGGAECGGFHSVR